MNRNKEIRKLEAEQRKDMSVVAWPLVTGKPGDDFLFSETVGSLIRIAVASELSDKELLCFVSKYILGWSKWHFHTVLNSIGKSHTAIGNSLKSAEEKIAKHIGKYRTAGAKARRPEPKEEVCVGDEVEEIFDDLSEKPVCWE